MGDKQIIHLPAHQIAKVFSETGNYWEIEACEMIYRFATPKAETECVWCDNG